MKARRTLSLAPPTLVSPTRIEPEKLAEGLLTAKEAAAFLGVSVSKVYQLMDAGRLPHVRLPTTGTRCIRRISRAVLLEWTAQHMTVTD